jgi:hypothetical protein
MFIRDSKITISFSFLFVLLSLMLGYNALGQAVPFKDKLWIEGKVHYGFVIPHHENLTHLAAQHFCMMEVDVVQASNGDHLWEEQHHYPLKGISFLYSDLGGSKPLGKAYACIPYLDFDLTRRGKVKLFFRFGAGLGYLSKRFSRLDNYKNIAIGSHFNAAIQLGYELRWKATPRLDVTAGVSLTHFSNGAIKIPNLGINIASLSAGCAYKLDKQQPTLVKNANLLDFSRKWEYRVFAMFGVSELYAAYGPKFPAMVLSATFLKPVGKTNKRRIGAGLDVFYDEANIESLSRIGKPVKSNVEVVRPGVNFTHQFNFSRLSLVLQLGAYVYTKYKGDGYIYDRLSLHYLFGKHYMVHLGLKTHLFSADMIEYGLGYKF